MYFFLYYSGYFFMYLVGLSLCVIDNDPSDTVYSDHWDDCEAFHARSINSDGTLNDIDICDGPINESMSNTANLQNKSSIRTSSNLNQMPIEVPEQKLNDTVVPHWTIEEILSLLNNSETFPSIHLSPDSIDAYTKEMERILNDQVKPPVSSETMSGNANSSESNTANSSVHPNFPTHKNVSDPTCANVSNAKKKTYPIFVSLNIRNKSRNIHPRYKYPNNISQTELEQKFRSQGNIRTWKELKEYTLNKHKRYWGYVCDYFWKKENPKDERSRGCFISVHLFPDSIARVRYRQECSFYTRAELLRCKCYYYIGNYKKPDSKSIEFAVHKHSDDEYFILNRFPENRNYFKLKNLLNGVSLFTPSELKML